MNSLNYLISKIMNILP
ncbi:hypothetical protein Gogos_018257 [Gossypium gossypioides]|uniref:Uncharacterized protein n=1 Tax=Gossypium gossypioides TaxID=34282 RepID=A0A7J9BDI6_GOSGO|nr:hypothetical protein [Gossypium gossypioides]